MRLLIKTLQQKSFPVDIEPGTLVSQLKTIIEATEKIDPIKQMLIYQGKILMDDKTIDSYHVKENDFIVLMATKPKATSSCMAAASVSTPTSAILPLASEGSQSMAAHSAASPTQATVVAASVPASASAAIDNSSTLVTGAAYEAAVQGLMEMGFDRELVIRALKASYHHPDRAAEYLFSGVIPNTEESHTASAAPTSSSGSSSISSLSFLRSDPQFLQLRSIVQQNPQVLQPLLQQIGIANPRLLQAINENQEEFIALLNEGLDEGHDEEDGEHDAEGAGEEGDEEDLDSVLHALSEHVSPEALASLVASRGGPAAATGGGGSSAGPIGAPQTQYIQVSSEEKDAIDRLVGLGFERAKVIEAFFACDKNETMAANYLFDHMNDADF